MTSKLTIKYKNKLYSFDSNKTLLEELQSHGIPINKGCGIGMCGVCKVKLVDGAIEYLRYPIAYLSGNEILTCISKANQDIEIESII